ncbi:MAG: hypothetical protein ACKOC5_04640, partial [Chloroflexota bacterium]
LTPSPTPVSFPTRSAASLTASFTPLPPTLTPGPNQMTFGQHVWDLASVQTPGEIRAIGRIFKPPTPRDPLQTYVYLRVNFSCTSGVSLIELYTGHDLGLTFIHSPNGYSDLSVEDYQGSRYLVNLVGACWLAAPVPLSQVEQGNFTLHFQSLPPLPLTLNQTTPQAAVRPILFTSRQDLNPEIYTLDPLSGAQTRMTNHPADDRQPAWSGDGRMVVFTTNRNGNYEIYRMDAAGANLANLTQHPADDSGPSWSAANGRIAFQSFRDGNWEIYSMAADGGDLHNLSRSPEADQMPAWSPDGRQLAFQSHRDGNWEIYVMAFDGSLARRLTENPAQDLAPAWSPDGEQIVFWSQRQNGWGLYILDLLGGAARPVIEYVNPGAIPSRPVWTADGGYILFAIQRGTNLELYRIRVDGGQNERLTKNESDDYDPSW